MRIKGLFRFFKDGFFLANRNLDLLFISILFSSLSYITAFFPDLAGSGTFVILSLFLVFFSSAFGLSLPVFIIQKQQNKNRAFKELLKVTLNNSKRIILPSILFLISLIFILIIIAIISFILINPSKEQVSALFQNSTFWYSLLLLLFLVLSIFEFTAIYFSLENQSLVKALISSAATSFKNLPFMMFIALIMLFMIALSILTINKSEFFRVMVITINHYLTFICTAASLLYYQKVLKKT